jgi:hypothetical protein
MNWLDWSILTFCWALPTAVVLYAFHRLRVRPHRDPDLNCQDWATPPIEPHYFFEDLPPKQSRLVNEGTPVGADEAKDSPQRERPENRWP